MAGTKKIRVLLAKPGLDGHDRGAKVVAKALRDAGMEVIYTGRHQTSEGITEAAIQEDVDIIGLSILSGAHMVHIPKLMQQLKDKGLADVPVVVGGMIPPADIPQLTGLGIREVFNSGTNTEDMIRKLRQIVADETNDLSVTREEKSC